MPSSKARSARRSSAPSGGSTADAWGTMARGSEHVMSRSSRSSANSSDHSAPSVGEAALRPSSARAAAAQEASGPFCSLRTLGSSPEESMHRRSSRRCRTRTARARSRRGGGLGPATMVSSRGMSVARASSMCSSCSSAAQSSRQRSDPATAADGVEEAAAAPRPPADSAVDACSGAISSRMSDGQRSGQSHSAMDAIAMLSAVRMRVDGSVRPEGSAARTAAFSSSQMTISGASPAFGAVPSSSPASAQPPPSSASVSQCRFTNCFSSTAASCRTSDGLAIWSRVSRQSAMAKPGSDFSCSTRCSASRRVARSISIVARSSKARSASRTFATSMAAVAIRRRQAALLLAPRPEPREIDDPAGRRHAALLAR